MTKRHYQLLALMLLIGAPLVVNLLANMLPGGQQIAAASAQTAPSADYVQHAANAEESPPPELAPSQQIAQAPPPPGEPFSVAPTIDPTGLATQGIDPMPADGSAPPPPAPAPAPAQTFASGGQDSNSPNDDR